MLTAPSQKTLLETTVITMTKGNEKKGVQGYVSGFLFLRKVIASTSATAVAVLFFFHYQKRSFLGWVEIVFRYYL